MAKFVQNENESPEVDLKNLTVRLSGMGMDKEIKDVIPGKKSKNYKVASEEEEPKEDTAEDETDELIEDYGAEDASDELIEENASDTDEFDEAESEEVESFFEKRAAERNLTLEKVEELENEMSSSEPSQVKKLTKIKAEEKVTKEKKKVKFDAVTVAGILIALAALCAGVFYIINSMNTVSSLGLTEKDYREKYLNTQYYKSILSHGFALLPPTYRDESSTNVSEGQYFDAMIDNDLKIPLYVTGIEVKGGKLLKTLRFYALVDSEEQINATLQIMGSYLVPLDEKLESQKAYEKICNAYSMSISSTERAVIYKDKGYAFSVSYNNINGYGMLVLDIIPESEADSYVFQDVI